MFAISSDAREEPLDDPTPRVDGEADLIGVFVDICGRPVVRVSASAA